MIGAIAKLLQAGVKYGTKKKAKKVSKLDYAKKSAKMKPGGQKPKGKTKPNQGPSKKIVSTGLQKPGMSKGYKLRKGKKLQISNLKRQMVKQGHSKELANKISKLQDQIDKSYKR